MDKQLLYVVALLASLQVLSGWSGVQVSFISGNYSKNLFLGMIRMI